MNDSTLTLKNDIAITRAGIAALNKNLKTAVGRHRERLEEQIANAERILEDLLLREKGI